MDAPPVAWLISAKEHGTDTFHPWLIATDKGIVDEFVRLSGGVRVTELKVLDESSPVLNGLRKLRAS